MKFLLAFLIYSTLIFNSFAQSWKPVIKAGFYINNQSIEPCETKLSFVDTSKILNPCNSKFDSCDNFVKWLWAFGDGTISNLKAPSHQYFGYGYFTIKFKAISKFGYSDSSNLLIYLAGPMPKFKVIGDTIIEIGDTAHFENISLDPLYNPSWIWNFGDKSGVFSDLFRRKASHKYMESGSFNVYLSMFDNVNGTNIRCKNTYPDTVLGLKNKISIQVKKSTSIQKNFGTQLTLYPNPARDLININGFEKGSLILSDMFGKEILKEEMNSNKSINISKLSKGIYFVKINSLGKNYTGKIIKE